MLQAQLDSIFNWSQTWGMTFNIDKCKVMHVGRTNLNYEYTMNGQKLQETENEKDVGVMFDSSMKPGMHCRNAARTDRPSISFQRQIYLP